jgi:oligopeptide/dipeptide ABC transporter ATP-binding protein
MFQEPTAALDPLRRVGGQVAEVIRLRRRMSRRAARGEAVEVLRRVGLEDPESASRAYPHELSGGMRQRASLALALACDPDVLIADEPTTALDSLLQLRVLETLREIGLGRARSLELITHDLAVLRSFADRIAVMYAGRIVEEAGARDLVEHPFHPYTRELLAAMPTLGESTPRAPSRTAKKELELGSGCRYAPRCPRRADACDAAEPELAAVPDERRAGMPAEHRAACWRAEEDA